MFYHGGNEDEWGGTFHCQVGGGGPLTQFYRGEILVLITSDMRAKDILQIKFMSTFCEIVLRWEDVIWANVDSDIYRHTASQ